MTRVKVCGIRRPQDAEAAVACGASALGFVFWPRSPRCVEPETVRAIIAILPPFVSAVGVFVNQPVDEVGAIAEIARLDTIQLHGEERPAEYGRLPYRLIKAVGVTATRDATDVPEVPDGTTVLLDAHDPVRLGGTGTTIDWTFAAAVARRRLVILSGGLRADNVQQAIGQVQPYAIDVSSGVESSPGVKDPVKLQAFFRAVVGASLPPFSNPET